MFNIWRVPHLTGSTVKKVRTDIELGKETPFFAQLCTKRDFI